MLKFKFSFIFILILIFGGCIDQKKPEQDKILIVLNDKLDTMCIIEYRGELLIKTKDPIIRRSVSAYRKTVVIKSNEKPIFKALGNK